MSLNSVWEQLSNRTEKNYQLPNADKKMVPTTVVHYVQTKFDEGSQFVTIPFLDDLKEKGVGGQEIAQGTEEKVKLRFAHAFYNVRRKAITFRNNSVDGDLTKAYNLLEQKVPLIKDWFAKLNDYDKHAALTVGCDEFLADDNYWTGDSITSAPVKRALHPNLLYVGQSAYVTYSATAATYMGSLVTALNTAYTSATTTFTKTVLMTQINWAQRHILPLQGKGYKHVMLLSDAQALQLRTDASSNGWLDTYKDAGARGDSNKAITGIIGIFQECLVIQNPRSPILNCDTTFSGDWWDRFQYVQPWSTKTNTFHWMSGDNRTPVVKGSGSGSEGTCEVAIILGRGAIAGAQVENLRYFGEKEDYDFSQGFCGQEKQGCVRMDIFDPSTYSSGVSSVRPSNQSSALFFTPTPAVAV